eukprot:1622419-Prymnesium_polylepis.2
MAHAYGHHRSPPAAASRVRTGAAEAVGSRGSGGRTRTLSPATMVRPVLDSRRVSLLVECVCRIVIYLSPSRGPPPRPCFHHTVA